MKRVVGPIMMALILMLTGCSSSVEENAEALPVKDKKEEEAAPFEVAEYIDGDYALLPTRIREIEEENANGVERKEGEVRSLMSDLVTDSYYDKYLDEYLDTNQVRTHPTLIPHNIFPEVRIDYKEDSPTFKSFTVLMFSDEDTTVGGYVDMDVKWEDGKWKLDDLKSRFPDFDLTEEEVQKLYGDNKITILGERDDQWYDNDHVKVYTYKVTEDGEEHYYDIYRNNGQRYEISNPEEIEKVAASKEEEPVVEETAIDPSVEEQESGVEGFSGNWVREGYSETYFGKINMTSPDGINHHFVGDALFGQNLGEMEGDFVADGEQAVYHDANMEGCSVTFHKTDDSTMEVVEGKSCGYGGFNVTFTGTYHLED